MKTPRGVTVVDEGIGKDVRLMLWRHSDPEPDYFPLTLHHMASLVEQLSAAMRLRLMDPQPAAPAKTTES